MNALTLPGSLRVMPDDYLPSGSMIVSRDVYNLIVGQLEPTSGRRTLSDPCPIPGRDGVHETYTHRGGYVCRACGADGGTP